MGTEDVPNSRFTEEIPGLATCDMEQRGSLNVEVEVDYAGFGKKCIIKRPFFLARLFAPPFHKFTLFATNGACLRRSGPDRVNRLQKVNSSGVNTIKFEDDSPPLVLLNKRIKDDSVL